jgi:protein-S-isoprenylcysteine O-methyltransferase Ste14
VTARLWIYLATFLGVLLVVLTTLDREVTRERLKKGQRTADPVILALLRIFSAAAILGGILDVVWLHVSDTVPFAVSMAALPLMVAGFLFALNAIRANRFFVPQVRIQADRGHRVIDSGPYRWIRHPGYAGMFVASPMGGLIIGSWLGFALGACASAVFAVRAFREDGFLKQNLAGYSDYATRTRYRLVPGLF